VISALKWRLQLRLYFIFHCATLKNVGEAFEFLKVEIVEKERSLWSRINGVEKTEAHFSYELCFGYAMIDEFRILVRGCQ
jgi:hypothetical protein